MDQGQGSSVRSNKAGIYPTADAVLVEIVEKEEKTAGGIVIPAAARDRESVAAVHGTVVDMGDAARLLQEMNGVEIGTLVIFGKFAGYTYRGKDGGQYRLLRARDIVAFAEGVFDQHYETRVPKVA